MKKKKILHINYLRQYRKLMRYTLTDVAKILGIASLNSLTGWEKGRTLPTVTNMFRLSILYKTLPEVLFQDTVSELRKEVSGKLKAKRTITNRLINNRYRIGKHHGKNKI